MKGACRLHFPINMTYRLPFPVRFGRKLAIDPHAGIHMNRGRIDNVGLLNVRDHDGKMIDEEPYLVLIPERS